MSMGTKRKAKALRSRYGDAVYVRIFERIDAAESEQSHEHFTYWRKVLDELRKYEHYLGNKEKNHDR